MRFVSFFFLPITGLLFAGCSVHPVPDDVSEYSTTEIVKNVRCEAKATVRERIDEALDTKGELREIDPERILEPENFMRIKRVDAHLAQKFQNYMDSAIAYDFEFTINELNSKSGSVGFLVPFLSGGSLQAGIEGDLRKSRTGDRRFKTVEKFRELVKLDCSDFVQPAGNLLYPMTGSIGMSKIMNTFIDLSELGGGKDSFTDTITFLTVASGKAGGALVLEPVSNQFRAVGAKADIDVSRSDTHKLTVSLAFPIEDLRPNSYERGSETRALENLCIARAEQRENEADTLRLYPPEIYCRRSEKESAAFSDRRLLE
ncbi:MAG: hypothetical protein B7Y80_19645 [Hyphomicrobium sp. 32-62-53]|nr:MAG: hypothetical protein B7Z29_19845 [Hyphomicrobium sp. 12-62-95]OYX97478.1 MAG: hypothetical protein B7Y80_19645 [Hyphomicrobium sp. 32-62-53]